MQYTFSCKDALGMSRKWTSESVRRYEIDQEPVHPSS